MGQFCYWDAKNLGDAIILIFFAAAVIAIGCVTSLRLRKSKHYGQYGKKIIVIYLLIIAWTTIMCGQHFYSIYVFFTFLYQNPNQSILPFAKNYVRFDILPGFIVQTIFLTICRYYYQGLMGAIEISHLSKWERDYITYLNVYYVVRIVVQFMGIALVNIFVEKDSISTFSQVNLWILVVDSIIMNIYLIVSLRIYLKGIKHIQSMALHQIKTLKIEYSIMILTSILRVVIDTVFVIKPLFDQASDQKCLPNDFSQHIANSILYKIVGNLINQFIPIICILKIYSYKNLQSDSNMLSQSDEPLVRSYLQ